MQTNHRKLLRAFLLVASSSLAVPVYAEPNVIVVDEMPHVIAQNIRNEGISPGDLNFDSVDHKTIMTCSGDVDLYTMYFMDGDSEGAEKFSSMSRMDAIDYMKQVGSGYAVLYQDDQIITVLKTRDGEVSMASSFDSGGGFVLPRALCGAKMA
jgi:hypothetical protein